MKHSTSPKPLSAKPDKNILHSARTACRAQQHLKTNPTSYTTPRRTNSATFLLCSALITMILGLKRSLALVMRIDYKDALGAGRRKRLSYRRRLSQSPGQTLTQPAPPTLPLRQQRAKQIEHLAIVTSKSSDHQRTLAEPLPSPVNSEVSG